MSDTLTPAGAYIRMSTDKQEGSPARQRSELEKLATPENCRIVEWYEDHVMTGTESAKRRDFQRLKTDANAGKIKAVLAYEQSRLSREDEITGLLHLKQLHDAGAVVITSKRGRVDMSTLSGIITALVDQFSSHDESKTIALRSASGKKLGIERGERVGGTPFAYDRELVDENGQVARLVDHRANFEKPRRWKSRLIISRDTAAVEAVQYMLQAFADGHSFNSIAGELRRRGVRPRSRQFTAYTVRAMLANPVDIGIMRVGASSQGKFARITDRPVDVENNHPAIVEPCLFNRVQAEMRTRHKRRGIVNGGRYILSGLAICGHCGGRMYAQVVPCGRRYYICCAAAGGRECISPRAELEVVDRNLLQVVIHRVLAANDAALAAEAMRPKDKSNPAAVVEAELAGIREKIAMAT